jgi:hypothetical protein
MLHVRLCKWWRHYVTSPKVAVSISDVIRFFNLPNHSSRTKDLGSTQALTEMNVRKLPWVKGGRRSKLSAVCEGLSRIIREPRRLTNILVSKACYTYRFYPHTLHNVIEIHAPIICK